MRTVAIDAGKRGCGVAVFEGNRLALAAYPQDKDYCDDSEAKRWETHKYTAEAAMGVIYSALGPIPAAWESVIEFPRIYRGRELEKDQNDLLDLAAVATRLCAGLTAPNCPVRFVHVSDWKGQLDKDEAWHHMQKALSPDEMRIYKDAVKDLPKKLHHNVQDAIGIGLWTVGRFGR